MQLCPLISGKKLPAAREDHDYYGPCKFWIRDIDGKICVVTAQTSHYDSRTPLGELQIWTLDKMVEQQRWSQKYNIKYAPNYIPGPHFIRSDRILTQCCSINSVYSYELLGESFETNMNKIVKVKLLDFSPRKPYNMQTYMCVKSLVCLDVYKKAGIVRRPKQREGWELKKWETWKRMLGKVADMRSCVHTREHDLLETTETMDEMCEVLQDKQPDLAERVRTELNQVLKHKPNNPDEPRSIQRLNWVGQKQDKGKLIARSCKVDQIIKAVKQAQDNISSVMRKYMLDQGISVADVYSSDGHGKESEEERPALALFI